jgi:hypothetical protein
MKRLVISIGVAVAIVSTSLNSVEAVSVGDVWVSELLANPLGTDTGFEWVELQNRSTYTLDISGLKVQRISGIVVATIPTGSQLQPAQATVYATTGSLLNSGDTLNLLQGTTLIDSVTYDATGAEGQSWVRLSQSNGTWTNQPTPGIVAESQTAQPSPMPLVSTPTPLAVASGVPTPNSIPTPSPQVTPISAPTVVAGPSAGPTPAVYPSPAASPYTLPEPGDVRISELLPNPDGVDTDNEWIELRNDSDHTLPLAGLHVERVSGSVVLQLKEGFIQPGECIVYQTTGSLLNNGDTLRLLLSGELIDEVVYDAAPDGETWIRLSETEGAWSDHPTPNAANVPHSIVEPETVSQPVAAVQQTAQKATTKTASKAKTTASKTAATKTLKKSSLPKTGPDLLVYAPPLLLATLYLVWRRRKC